MVTSINNTYIFPSVFLKNIHPSKTLKKKERNRKKERKFECNKEEEEEKKKTNNLCITSHRFILFFDFKSHWSGKNPLSFSS